MTARTPRPMPVSSIRFVPPVALVVAAFAAHAQFVPPAVPAPAAAPQLSAADPLAPFAWLEGCWKGAVNQREFREHWMPLRGGMMLGISHNVMAGKTQGYEYLRIEPRPDGVFYVAVPSGKKEDAFRFTGKTIDTNGDANHELFAFENPALEFPRKIVYRRATGGWLYAQVEGKVGGADREVIYPMRRTDCETGETIEK
jgi:Domain of unknown function (DUF6265)